MPVCRFRNSPLRVNAQSCILIAAMGLLLASLLAGCATLPGMSRIFGSARPKPVPQATAAPTPAPPPMETPPELNEERPERENHPRVKAAPKPAPVVTSTNSPGQEAASLEQAQTAIDDARARLAHAASADPSAKLDIIRAMIDSAQQALNDQDYLTARSLARKAAVLANQAAGQSAATPTP